MEVSYLIFNHRGDPAAWPVGVDEDVLRAIQHFGLSFTQHRPADGPAELGAPCLQRNGFNSGFAPLCTDVNDKGAGLQWRTGVFVSLKPQILPHSS